MNVLASVATQPDSLPDWFWAPAAVLVWIAYIVLEFRASKREHDASHASSPVVVTGSGRRSNRGPRSCAGVQ